VCSISDTPIQWPMTRNRGGPAFLFVTRELVRAIRRESNQAVANHWGVTPQT
jgi:hypothetical protein